MFKTKTNEFFFSYLASIPAITAVLGSFVAGFLAKRFGRKAVQHWSLVPCIAAWILQAFGTTYASFLISRGLVGVAVGTLVPIGQLYLVDISTPSTRGFITSTTMLWQVFYNLLQYIIGIFVSWKVLAIVNAAIHVIYFPIGFFVPESPTWCLAKGGRDDQARKGLQFLRGPNVNVEPEIAQIKKLLEHKNEEDSGTWRDFFQWEYLRPMLILFAMIFFRQFTGIFSIVSYTVDIFEDAGGAISPEWSTVIVGVVQLVFVALSNVITDKIGRKKLMVCSAMTMAVSHGVFGLYYYMHEHADLRATADKVTWIPLVALVLFMIGFSLGFASSFYVLMSEMIPNKIKDHASGLASQVNNVANFVVLELYYPMKDGLTDAGTFWFYGGMCFTAGLFAAFLLPETKGISLQELEEKLTQSRRRSQVNLPSYDGSLYVIGIDPENDEKKSEENGNYLKVA